MGKEGISDILFSPMTTKHSSVPFQQKSFRDSTDKTNAQSDCERVTNAVVKTLRHVTVCRTSRVTDHSDRSTNLCSSVTVFNRHSANYGTFSLAIESAESRGAH